MNQNLYTDLLLSVQSFLKSDNGKAISSSVAVASKLQSQFNAKELKKRSIFNKKESKKEDLAEAKRLNLQALFNRKEASKVAKAEAKRLRILSLFNKKEALKQKEILYKLQNKKEEKHLRGTSSLKNTGNQNASGDNGESTTLGDIVSAASEIFGDKDGNTNGNDSGNRTNPSTEERSGRTRSNRQNGRGGARRSSRRPRQLETRRTANGQLQRVRGFRNPRLITPAPDTPSILGRIGSLLPESVQRGVSSAASAGSNVLGRVGARGLVTGAAKLGLRAVPYVGQALMAADAIAAVHHALEPVLAPIESEIADKVSETIETVQNAVTNNSVIKTIGDTVNHVSESASNVGDSILNTVQNLLSSDEDKSKQAILDAQLKATKDQTKTIVQNNKLVEENTSGFSEYSEKLGGYFDSFASTLMGSFGSIKNIASNVSNNAVNASKTFVDKAVTYTKKVGQELGSKSYDTSPDVAESLYKNGVVGAAKTAGSKVSNKVSEKWKNFHFSDVISSVIKTASADEGVDENFMRTMAYIESKGDPNAVSPTNAKGLNQFIPSSAKRYGIAGKEFDPMANTKAAARMAKDNAAILIKAGVEPTPENLYKAHQQGSAGLIKLSKLAERDAQWDEIKDIKLGKHTLGYNMEVNGSKGLSARQYLAKWDKKYEEANSIANNSKTSKSITPTVKSTLLASNVNAKHSTNAIAQNSPTDSSNTILNNSTKQKSGTNVAQNSLTDSSNQTLNANTFARKSETVNVGDTVFKQNTIAQNPTSVMYSGDGNVNTNVTKAQNYDINSVLNNSANAIRVLKPKSTTPNLSNNTTQSFVSNANNIGKNVTKSVIDNGTLATVNSAVHNLPSEFNLAKNIVKPTIKTFESVVNPTNANSIISNLNTVGDTVLGRTNNTANTAFGGNNPINVTQDRTFNVPYVEKNKISANPTDVIATRANYQPLSVQLPDFGSMFNGISDSVAQSSINTPNNVSNVGKTSGNFTQSGGGYRGSFSGSSNFALRPSIDDIPIHISDAGLIFLQSGYL